jgi:hypothetical protein
MRVLSKKPLLEPWIFVQGVLDRGFAEDSKCGKAQGRLIEMFTGSSRNVLALLTVAG